MAVPFAGNNFGAFFIPDVDSEVLVAFTAGDAGWPVVIGNVWNGATELPESLPGSAVDRWTLTGKAGTRIAIVEQSEATATISFETPGGVSGTLTDEAGGKVEFVCSGSTVTITPQGVKIETGGKVEVSASQVNVSAGMVQVDAGLSKFSGVVQCDTLIASSIVATTYTPGAGNVW